MAHQETQDGKHAEKSPKPKARQGRLAGMTPKPIAEIQDAAQELLELRTERMEIAEREEKAQDGLLTLMKQHNLKEYKLDEEYHAVIETVGERAYVRRILRGRPKKKDNKEGEK